MKFSLAAAFVFIAVAHGQVVVPATPKNFKMRPIGDGASVGADVEKVRETTLRYVAHIVLSESRLWTSAEGKPLEAKLIAFEDLVAVVPKDSAEPKMPEPPAKPTVTRDDKVRLLVNQKPVEIAMDRLSVQDRGFIDQIKAAMAKKAAAAK